MPGRATVTIDRLGHLGDGIGAGPDGAPVFAPRTLPGEVVAGDVEGGRIARPRILTPSPDRIRADCPHYVRCGGCSLMHARDGFVADWKRHVVLSALAGRGIEAEVRSPLTSPLRSRRRATLAGRRLKGGPVVGFHTPSGTDVVPVPDCRVLRPEIVAGLPAFAALTDLAGSRKGEVRFAVTVADAGLDVALTGGKALDRGLSAEAAALAGAHGIARLTWDGEPVAQAAPPAVALGRARVVPPPGAFLQATAEGEAALCDAVRATVGDAARVLDLFAGCGTFALPLAERAEVHAVEADRAMTDALLAGWKSATGLRRVTAETRDLFRRPLDADDLKGFDAAVIDPPRAGAEAQATALAQGGPDRVAMVSCNPVTFARDAALLIGGGYGIGPVTVVDQFRWSPHVELAASFTRS